MNEKKVNVDIGNGRVIEISTGKLANLANGACVIKLGETVILVAACTGPAKEGGDFLPLQVDYREKYSAAGRFPGGYIKREGRPSDKEILTCRMTDRPVRPLFPEGFFNEIQIQALLLSSDGENESDVLTMLGASVALTLSDMPFLGPIGALRVGYVDGKFVANPTHDERAKSQLELVYAGVADKVIMIEGDAKECSEDLLRDAMSFANEIVKKQIVAQKELAASAGRKKKEPTLHLVPAEVKDAVHSFCKGKIEGACLINSKEERYAALNMIFEGIESSVKPQFDGKVEDLDVKLKMCFDHLTEKTIRTAIVEKGVRPDGRGMDDLRQISCEVGVLPRVHGSGLFTRGETQALVIVTLGAGSDAQDSDPITGGISTKQFFLHYNFPNFSVNEVGRISGPGRREIGHGNLAERSLAQMMPDDYPYTVRCVSEIMASNGSTSMASVCGGTLALLDAGVLLKAPVAGISCGLICEGDKNILLTDIIGAEDHYGDMDFKVCGTRNGITGFQLDLKIPGISIDLLYQAMKRNLDSRLKILDMMNACIAEPRAEMSKYAPRIIAMKINTEKIGALIGPGGSVIRGITESTGAQIDIDDDGTVKIFAANKESLDAATKAVQDITAEVEVGKIYRGRVTGMKEFGVFVEIIPGQDGLLHISEMANYRVNKVTDICQEGDMVTVKVIGVDDRGKIRLSRKAALEELDDKGEEKK
ncbi:MAG TPA: polyribonucleotide nucleotidyltransferase [Lentisphaeria bacterium]|nr:MAG: polyribonucleotide nucleotidyltransferase [Lentisphaerae bacterium GWF2_50_93]HCE42598.1 polyribonucleotide nucleotidyltransferase [Lentisphaeria bacterium]